MARIFISYSRKDETFARQLATSLTASGADVWIDLEDIPAGMKWSSAIQDGLDQGDLMVVIISPDSMASRNVEDEWQYYLDNGKPVIPVLLHPAKIHFQLARIQYIDFHKQAFGRALNQLYTEFRRKGVALELAPNAQEKAPISHTPPTNVTQPIQRPSQTSSQAVYSTYDNRQQRRNRLIIGGGIVAALVMGLLVGLLAFQNSPTPEVQTAVFDQVGVTSTARVEVTRTAAVQPSLTSLPTATATNALRLGIDTRVSRNAEWTPVMQSFGGVDMMLVPAGCFQMGSSDAQISEAVALCPLSSSNCNDLLSDERPQAQICFERPFWIDRTEVTNFQFGSSGRWQNTNLPRENVSWGDALAHCEGRGASLPTEAAWEYAARGPDGLIFPWGNTFDGTKLNYCDSNCEFNWRDAAYSDLNPYPAPVGAYPAGTSWVGALDMAGSLWEWTSTIYSAYPYDPSDGRENLNDRSSARTLRGGAWNWIALDARTTGRDNPVQPSSDWYGFRCARDYVEGDLP